MRPLPYQVNVQADLSHCWSHRSYCKFCRALAHLSVQSLKAPADYEDDLVFSIFTLFLIRYYFLTKKY